MAYTPAPNSILDLPDQNDSAMVVAPRPASIDRISFAKAVSGGVDTSWGSVIRTGTNMTVNQTSGNLVLTTGTTANQETIIRSARSYTGGIRLRAQTTLSQRIANTNYFVELVDVIGDAISLTINSATSISVNFATSIFDSSNLGQSFYIGNYTGSGSFPPGRYMISSVVGNSVTIIGSGFTAGSGTCSVFGWNYYHLLYDGTTATTMKFDTQRRGYNTGDTTVANNTTASPGHLAIITGNDMQATVSDQLVASVTTPRNTVRGSRDTNVPDDAQLYVQIRMVNGTTAPASTSTWTIGFIAVGNYASQDVVVQDLRQSTNNTPLPVDIQRAVSLTTSTVNAVTATPVAGTGYSLVTAATTNAAVIKASGGSLFEITTSNVTAATIYVKLFNKASAPTVGTDVPVITIPVASGALSNIEFGGVGKRLATGIAIAVTAGAAATDATAVTAGAQISATVL